MTTDEKLDKIIAKLEDKSPCKNDGHSYTAERNVIFCQKCGDVRQIQGTATIGLTSGSRQGP